MSAQPAGPAFQLEAVERIMERFAARTGPRRYLLADEVGLGKTHVAREVIRRLGKRRRLCVLYICSNTEVAAQNQQKLDPQESVMADRLTLLAPDLTTLRKRKPLLLSLTPGTSLYLTRGDGTVAERALTFTILKRIRPNHHLCRHPNYFCGHAGKDTWRRKLRDLRRVRLSSGLVKKIRQQWRLVLAGSKATGGDARAAGVKTIRLMRQGLAQAVLDHLSPDLLVFDEFQKFSELFQVSTQSPEGSDQRSVKRHLLADWFYGSSRAVNTRMLLLSATPYRLYAPDDQDLAATTHLKDFKAVLRFLRATPVDDQWSQQLDGEFGRLRKGLDRLGNGEEAPPDLLECKEAIERRLQSVMCRTERNWYYQDHKKGIEEVPKGDKPLPSAPELADLRALATKLSGVREPPTAILDYWKSCARSVAFMQSHYKVRRRLKNDGDLRPTVGTLSRGFDANLRLRRLAMALMGPDTSDLSRLRRWRYLWTRPRYQYWASDHFSDADPTKLLVFSHWRFVPGAIALLVSDLMERALRISELREWRAGRLLRFDGGDHYSVFDVCYPSSALALTVDPITLAAESLGKIDRTALEREAKRVLRARFAELGVSISRKTGSVSTWKAIAQLESECVDRDKPHEHLRVIRLWARRRDTERHARRHVLGFESWMRDSEPSTITPAQLRRIARIALYSPAVCLVRAFRREGYLPAADQLLDTCLGSLRNFFNKPYAKSVVRRCGGRGTYSEQVLEYCAEAQIAAVMDEYVHLTVSQHDPNEAVQKGLKTIASALSIEPGAPQVLLKGKGRRARRAHFALAFTEQFGADEGRGKQRTSTREAFNSPFWPFVLATTSLGQEGLDFHQYCRDIVHWNLPTNPVDLEQREGRINRRNSLLVRQGVRQAVPPSEVSMTEGSLWSAAFIEMVRKHGEHGTRHGLFPHWVNDVGAKNCPRLRRHLYFYQDSRDLERYEVLKKDLALYRLAFGQAKQEDLVRSMRKLSDASIRGKLDLEQYMINLSPFRKDYAWHAALADARAHCSDAGWRRRLLADAVRLRQRFGSGTDADKWRSKAVEDLDGIVSWLSLSGMTSAPGAVVLEALAALVYLRNPYDDVFDRHKLMGLQDDAGRLRSAAQKLRTMNVQ